MDLKEYWLNNTGKKITKWTHYFPVYEKHFKPLTDKPIKVLEIGILNGGSLQMWRKYFHPDSVIVGIDINPDCKVHEEDDVHVRIGDQSDPEFLQSLIDEFGKFDLVIDDGSHHVSHVNKTFQFLYPKIQNTGIYLIEDTHAAYWSSHGGSMDNPETINNVSKSMVDKINAEHTHGQIKPDFFTYETKCMSVYDSIVVFERGNVGAKRPEEYGGPKSNEVFIIKTH
jgi:cephalosporin hydroxylase